MVKDRDLGLISLDSSPPCASFWLFVAFHILYLTVYSSFLSHEYPQKIQLQRSPKLGLWFQCYGNKNRPAKDIEAFYRAQHLFRTDRREKNRTGSPCKVAFQNATYREARKHLKTDNWRCEGRGLEQEGQERMDTWHTCRVGTIPDPVPSRPVDNPRDGTGFFKFPIAKSLVNLYKLHFFKVNFIRTMRLRFG